MIKQTLEFYQVVTENIIDKSILASIRRRGKINHSEIARAFCSSKKGLPSRETIGLNFLANPIFYQSLTYWSFIRI